MSNYNAKVAISQSALMLDSVLNRLNVVEQELKDIRKEIVEYLYPDIPAPPVSYSFVNDEPESIENPIKTSWDIKLST